MNLLKKLFGETKQNRDTGKTVQKINATHLLRASVVFSHGWNDQSEIIHKQNAILLDLVAADESVDKKTRYWNKKYYDFITQHYSITENQLESISSIIGVDKTKYRELYDHWPKSLSDSQYDQLYKILNLKFVRSVPLSDEFKGKFVIVINESFWNIKTHHSNVLTDMINAYERSIHDFELFHDNYEEALEYGLIICDRLCIERPPSSTYYYHDRLIRELHEIKKGPKPSFQTLDYHVISNSAETVKAEYKRISEEKADELKHLKLAFDTIKNRPFTIYKII